MNRMALKERVYSVLLISASEKLNQGLAAHLPVSRYSPIDIVSDIASAQRIVLERSYDLVLINSPLPDDAGLHFAIDTATAGDSAVLLMVRAELHEQVLDAVTEYGIFVLSKPISGASITLALNWMCSARERLKKSEEKALTLEEKMEEIRIVNRAKWLLIDVLKMTEPEAHRFIEKQAMDRCVTRRVIAESVIRTYSGS